MPVGSCSQWEARCSANVLIHWSDIRRRRPTVSCSCWRAHQLLTHQTTYILALCPPRSTDCILLFRDTLDHELYRIWGESKNVITVTLHVSSTAVLYHSHTAQTRKFVCLSSTNGRVCHDFFFLDYSRHHHSTEA